MNLLPVEQIQKRIYSIRGFRVMLDSDLAEIYGVPTRRLNEQVKRNQERFPDRFMFRLTKQEGDQLMRSQFATGSKRNIRFTPYVFTEHGALMLAAVLKCTVAVKASIAIVEAFVQLRELLSTHRDLADKLEELEKRYDNQFKIVFDAIRELMAPSKSPPMRQIKGFRKA